jgi:hypothetical protein
MSETVLLTVANAGYDFHGCDHRDPDHCACATWDEAICPVCEERIAAGQDIYLVIRERFPYLPEDADEQDWETIEWHKACDQGSVAAEVATT